MNCSSSEALFEKFLDGELNPRERATLLSHIDTCPDCRSVLEELRVVDALLLEPRAVTLAPNFTFATMAEVRSLRTPQSARVPVLAYIVSYLAAAWLIAAATFWLAPQIMHALDGTLVDIAASIALALVGISRVVAHSFARDGSALTAALLGLLVLDATLACAVWAALKYVRPRLAERLRS